MPEVWEGKKYTMTESEGFNEYMKEIGVGWGLRIIGNNTTPTVSLSKNGDEYNLLTESTFKNSEIKFKLGEEFEEETLDGRKVKSVMTMDGNKLIQNQGGNPPSTITREFFADTMKATMTVNGVTATRVYKTDA